MVIEKKLGTFFTSLEKIADEIPDREATEKEMHFMAQNVAANSYSDGKANNTTFPEGHLVDEEVDEP